MKLEFFDRFLINSQISNFMKIRPVVAELFHADGTTDRQTDMTKLTVAFRNFPNAPKNENSWKTIYDKLINSKNKNLNLTYC
jgi:hypothetical protein